MSMGDSNFGGRRRTSAQPNTFPLSSADATPGIRHRVDDQYCQNELAHNDRCSGEFRWGSPSCGVGPVKAATWFSLGLRLVAFAVALAFLGPCLLYTSP